MCFGGEGSFKESGTPREGELSRIKAALCVANSCIEKKIKCRNTMQYNRSALFGHMGGSG